NRGKGHTEDRRGYLGPHRLMTLSVWNAAGHDGDRSVILDGNRAELRSHARRLHVAPDPDAEQRRRAGVGPQAAPLGAQLLVARQLEGEVEGGGVVPAVVGSPGGSGEGKVRGGGKVPPP